MRRQPIKYGRKNGRKYLLGKLACGIVVSTIRQRPIEERLTMTNDLQAIKSGSRRGRPASKHTWNKLTPISIRAFIKPGAYADGGGLYLSVAHAESRSWIFRVQVKGKRREIGLGSLRDYGLAEARDRRDICRKAVRDDLDPSLVVRGSDDVVVPTFKQVAEDFVAEHIKSLKNAKSRQQWGNTLATYVYPEFGDLPVNQVDTSHVLKVLRPIWTQKAETASRVRQRIGKVLDWAKGQRYRSGDNPAEQVVHALPKQRRKIENHEALPYGEVGAFLKELRASTHDKATVLAFELLVLTGVRTTECRKAEWREIDLSAKTWTIPAVRMKADRDHVVPLSDRAVALVEQARALNHVTWLFPMGGSKSRPVHENAFLEYMKKSAFSERGTPHGMRSSFRDWSSEETNFSHEVCEQALAHTIKNKAEKAYRRGDLLAKRRELMQAWADYVG